MDKIFNEMTVINEAREWLGTPFHLHGRIKGIGCDCLGLVMGLAKNLKLKTISGKNLIELDDISYPLNYNGNSLTELLDSVLKPVYSNTLPSGHLALMAYDTIANHFAIISNLDANTPSIIHSSYTVQKVVEQRLDENTILRIKKIYKLVN